MKPSRILAVCMILPLALLIVAPIILFMYQDPMFRQILLGAVIVAPLAFLAYKGCEMLDVLNEEEK